MNGWRLGVVWVVLAACGGGGERPPDAGRLDDGVDAGNSNASLSALVVSRGELVPPFEPDVTDYALALPLGVEAVEVTATAAVSTTTITIADDAATSGAASSVALLPGTQDVVVAATAGGGAQTVYRIAARRGEPAVTLSSLGGAVSNPLTPAFDPATDAYAVAVGRWLKHLQVTVVPVVAGSSITVAGGAVDAGAASPPIALNLGLTSIPIVVTDPAGAATTYTLDVTRATDVAPRVYAKASNPGAPDLFGYALAISGDTLVVGAGGEASASTGVGGNQADDSAPNSGAVYVFRRAGDTWTQEAYLKASNTQAGDFFGGAVAIDGDTLAVAAVAEASGATGVGGNQADNSVAGAGAVYVFTRTGTTWTQQAYVKSPSPDVDDNFGTALALSGDTLAIGAQTEDSAATGIGGDPTDDTAASSGAVYVVTRTGTTWSPQAYVKASDAAAGGFFGASLALAGDTLAVGAFGANAAYVFTRAGEAWSAQARVAPAAGAVGDAFGWSVALSGDSLAVGAPFEDGGTSGPYGDEADNSVSASGAAYVFTRAGAAWSQQLYVKAWTPDVNDEFGQSVALWGDTLAFGTRSEDGAGIGINEDFADDSLDGAGAAFVYVRTGTNWMFSAYVKPTNPGLDDRFGAPLVLDGDTLVIAADHEDSGASGLGGNQADNSVSSSGAVYVFR